MLTQVIKSCHSGYIFRRTPCLIQQNSGGGKVILGIEDETNVVHGIGEESPFKLSDSISNMISDACTPQIAPDISIQTVEDKTILVIDVLPGKFRPYYIASKGKETTAYIRINGTSRPADARKLKELELEGQNLSYDSMQLIGKEYDEALALKLCKEMQRVALESCKSDDERADVKEMTIEKLEDFGVFHRTGKQLVVTHAFDLLTENKNRYAKIQCALFKGLTRDVFIDQKEFTGPIYEQVDAAYHFILRHINMGAEINGVYRNDTYELPINAIREMIANAVVHRSYLDDSCVQVCIFDDRVEVLSPGTLYGGLDIETAKKGKSRCRNGAIAEAFHYMHIIEAWGTGIPRIINRCKEYGLREPVFEEFGDSFKVTMYRKVVNGTEKAGNGVQYGQVGKDGVGRNKESENLELKHSSVLIGLDIKGYARIMEYLEVPRSRKEIQKFCGYKSRDSFMKNILNPLIDSGKVNLLLPDKPKSPKQKYVKNKQ
ncbi:MAG: ATP-binding protein [Lachnospiraceae bacterium]